jgi:hypothetical protein
LKNGKKRTYREWKELTTKIEHPEIPSLIRPPTPPKRNTNVFLDGATTIKTVSETVAMPISRDQRLDQIKNKLRKLQDEETAYKTKKIEELNIIEQKINNKISEPVLDELPEFNDNSSLPDISELIKNRDEKIEKEKEKTKNYFKKTVKRKFTLGKSDKLRKVSVLIKDKQTRKNIINTQKELKKTSINDVTKYLRQHGMIKIGSTCPADILRKTFETALLTGEVTNLNKDTLLHNFLHDAK